jgi:hypothetical protein
VLENNTAGTKYFIEKTPSHGNMGGTLDRADGVIDFIRTRWINHFHPFLFAGLLGTNEFDILLNMNPAAQKMRTYAPRPSIHPPLFLSLGDRETSRLKILNVGWNVELKNVYKNQDWLEIFLDGWNAPGELTQLDSLFLDLTETLRHLSQQRAVTFHKLPPGISGP